MTLATTCPRCASTFRVQAEQLRQRDGMVRCGVCRHAFDALDALQPLEGSESQPDASPATPAARPVPHAEAGTDFPLRTASGTNAARGATRPAADEAHLPGLLRASGQPTAAASPPVPSSAAARLRPAEVEATTARPAPRSGPFAPPRQPDRAAFALRAGSLTLLTTVALLQIALLSRDVLAARAPGLEPVLATLAGAVGLRIELPRRLSSLTLEGFDLQAGTEPSQLVLSALVRNTGGVPTQWPAMEITLTDASGAVVVRKALLPVEYLPEPARLQDGIGARSELPIRLVLQVPEAAATRYGASLFYP